MELLANKAVQDLSISVGHQNKISITVDGANTLKKNDNMYLMYYKICFCAYMILQV